MNIHEAVQLYFWYIVGIHTSAPDAVSRHRNKAGVSGFPGGVPEPKDNLKESRVDDELC